MGLLDKSPMANPPPMLTGTLKKRKCPKRGKKSKRVRGSVLEI